MRNLLAFLLLSFCLVSCSVPSPDDGADGRDGKPGEEGRDGEDGQDGQDGEDGIDGRDAVIGFKVCKLSWPGQANNSGSYEISYAVMDLASGVKHADFNVVYKTEAAVSFSESASGIVEGNSSLETANWKAEMADESNAIFTRKAMGQIKTAACK